MIRLFGQRSTDSIALLTRAVALVYDAPLPALCRTAAGKPYFPDRPTWHFSLSHSGMYTLCALSDRPVGVDIERVRPRAEGLPAWVMSAAERAAWDGTWDGFYAVWTTKEAWGKYRGTGLCLPLRDMAVAPDVRVGHVRGDGWMAAVCTPLSPPTDIEWLDQTDASTVRGEKNVANPFPKNEK